MDWQLTCRVCLETGDMVSLFDWDENNEQLGDKYTYCCGVEVTKNDSLPTLICLNCVDRLTYACQFKQQCLSSIDTLKECLDEFEKSSAAAASGLKEESNETETITIKQENGLLLQYELPVEHDPQSQWTRTLIKTPNKAVVTKAPTQRKRGRPRKYPNQQGEITTSPYQRKKPKPTVQEPEALTTLLASGSLDLKQEPNEEPFENDGAGDDDPDFFPDDDAEVSESENKTEKPIKRPRGRPRKNPPEAVQKSKDEDGEDVLLKETILAFSEPIPDHILNPKPKKKSQPKKKYVYDKIQFAKTPRVYKPEPGTKRYKKYDQDLLRKAVEEYLTNLTNGSIKIVAAKYNIHPSVLFRHIKSSNMKAQGGQPALSLETELYIIKYLNICAQWGYPLDSLGLRYIIKMYLDKLGIAHKRFKNNLPGPEFIQGFLNRHKDEISCQNIKRSRAAVSSETFEKYFDELKQYLAEVPPENIVNYDETKLADDPGQRKIITKRGTKYPDRVMNHPKANVSIMIAGSAEGQLLPPYVVYKAQNLDNNWISQGPEGARYNRSQSGWFDGIIFEDWVQSIVIPFFANKSGKKLLIGDNLSVHLSVDIIRKCKDHEIDFIFLPSNSTHLTQPLDVAFFRPMKIAWRQILLEWKKTDGINETCVPKGCFPKLLKKLMDAIQENAGSNLKAGFRKCGIYPYDPSQVLSRVPTQLSDNGHREALDLLNDMRCGTMGVKEELDVVPGKSVSEPEEEIESLDKKTNLSNAEEKKKESIKAKGVGKITITMASTSRNVDEKMNLIDLSVNRSVIANDFLLGIPTYYEDDCEKVNIEYVCDDIHLNSYNQLSIPAETYENECSTVNNE